MWNFSSEVQADVDFLKASNLQNIKVEGLDYDREKWMELMNCHAHLSTNLTESSERSPEEKPINYYNVLTQNQNHLKYSNKVLMDEEFQLEPDSTSKSVELMETSPIKSNNEEELKSICEKLQIITDCMRSKISLTNSQLRDVLEIAVHYNVDVDCMKECTTEILACTDINTLYELIVSLEPNTKMIEGFLKLFVIPMVSTGTYNRSLEQYLISCFKTFTNQMVYLIILPMFSHLDEKNHAMLMVIIKSASYKEKHYILEAIADQGSLTKEQVPILDKLITTHMDSALISKLVYFIHKFKDSFCNIPSFGILLVNIVKSTNTKMLPEVKEVLIETVRCNGSMHRRFMMKHLGINE